MVRIPYTRAHLIPLGKLAKRILQDYPLICRVSNLLDESKILSI